MDHDSWLQALLEAPDDGALRLVYADWLEERGEPRADWLRLAAAASAVPDPGEAAVRALRLERQMGSLCPLADLRRAGGNRGQRRARAGGREREQRRGLRPHGRIQRMADRPALPEIGWLAAAENPWGVPVLDVRPVTLGMLSTSRDPRCAANAASFGNEDGTCFREAQPRSGRSVAARLRYRVDRLLADGVLFNPAAMEQKWALYHHQGRILCVRSWLRQVEVVADVRAEGGWAEVTAIRGAFTADEEEPAFTERTLDYLLRSHALNLVHPAPLPPGMDQDPGAAALWCMSCFGNRALVAAAQPVPCALPEQPLRTDSLLHIAVARGDAAAVEAQLRAGVPVDLLARDGLAPLHWALPREDNAIAELLLAAGSPVDVRSAEGATPLMNAVQGRSVAQAQFLLERGADANAVDRRGFTALHRAAEMGEVSLARLLLERGARPDAEAGGHTPRSLAAARGEAAVVELLDGP